MCCRISDLSGYKTCYKTSAMRHLALLGLVCASTAHAAVLKLHGDDNRIQFGPADTSAILKASCNSQPASFVRAVPRAYFEPDMRNGGSVENVTVQLMKVPLSCSNVDPAEPCAGSGSPLDEAYFFCNWHGDNGNHTNPVPVAAYTVTHKIEDMVAGVWVLIQCVVLPPSVMADITGYDGVSGNAILRLSISHGTGSSAIQVPFEGLTDGDKITFTGLGTPPQNPPPGPPPTSPLPPHIPPALPSPPPPGHRISGL